MYFISLKFTQKSKYINIGMDSLFTRFYHSIIKIIIKYNFFCAIFLIKFFFCTNHILYSLCLWISMILLLSFIYFYGSWLTLLAICSWGWRSTACASLLLRVSRSMDAFEAFASSRSSLSLAPCKARYFFAMASQSVTVSIRFDRAAKLTCDPYGLKCTTLTDMDSTEKCK